jgi:hypothetical protein
MLSHEHIEYQALLRLVDLAKSDTGQARRVADFLLAWWNAGECGSFDLTCLWALDASIARDMQAVFGLIARVHQYPDQFDPALGPEFRKIIERWRPELIQ